MPYVSPLRRAATERLAEAFVKRAVSVPGVSEGRVRSRNRATYRRLDCGGRALAYVRGRPSAGGVRIDISGLWVRPEHCGLEIPKDDGPPSLVVRSAEDLIDALAFLEQTIQATQSAYAREARLRLRRRRPSVDGAVRGPLPRRP